MKKIVVLLAFLNLFFMEAQAQGQADIRFGFQASPGISWMTVTDDRNIGGNGTNFGLRLGLVGEYYFRENYALWGGINFAFGQGGTLLFDESGRFWPNSDIPSVLLTATEDGVFPAETNLEYRIQYVEIPFGLKLKTREFGYLQYFVEIPTFAIGIRSQARGEAEVQNGPDVNPEVEGDDFVIRQEVNPFTFSIGIGVGAEYNISSSTALVAGLAYQRTVTDVLKDNSDFDAKANINNIILRVAVMF